MGTPRILIAEDLAIVREPIALILQRHGMTTIAVADGRAAIQRALQDVPDLVLLDIGMPQTDGIEVLRHLREQASTADVPVIMLTDSCDRETIVEAVKLGISSYLLKSQFSIDTLLDRVRSALHGTPVPALVETPPSAPTQPIQQVKQDASSAETLKEFKPRFTRDEVEQTLESCGELNGLSPTVSQILKLTANANCSMDAIVRVIKQDQATSLQILKMANSSLYMRGEPVDSVQRAVMRIGLSQLRQTVLNLSVIEKFSGVGTDGRLDMLDFWEHSIATGLIAARITQTLTSDEEEADAAFTMGLLHDVGRMVYIESFGERYREIIDIADDLKLPLEEVESRLMLINHAEAMDRILHAWKFPKRLINPIAFHHLSAGNIRRMSAKTAQEGMVLALANRLAHALMLGSSGNPTLYPTDELMSALKVDASFIKKIEVEAPEQTNDIKIAMISRTGSRTSASSVSTWRERVGSLCRPQVICSDPATDPIRITIDQIAPQSEPDERPPVAVVHLADSRQRHELSKRVSDAQGDSKTRTMPLVIISETGGLKLDDNVMATGPAALLRTPLSLSRLAEAIANLIEACPSAP